MDTNTIRCMVKCDQNMSQQVIGIFSADEIPKWHFSSSPIAFIINTDRKSGVGKHWVAFYVSGCRGEFFDSYGFRPSFYSDVFHDYFSTNNLNLLYNDKRLQSTDSKTCGYYCVYYLVNRCKGVPMNEIVCPFSNDYNNNDLFIFDVIRNTFPYCTGGYTNHGF